MTTLRTLRAIVFIGALPLVASAQDRGARVDTTLMLSRGGQVDLATSPARSA